MTHILLAFAQNWPANARTALVLLAVLAWVVLCIHNAHRKP